MNLPRFLIPGLEPGAREARLPADEAHHLSRVMRLGPGDEVAIFDGKGHEFRARVSTASRESATVEILEALTPAPEPHTAIALVQAVLKGEKMDDVVRDATMMGVAAIEPLVTLHTVARRQSVERWERVAVSSAKQCRRAVVPRIAPVRTPAEWLAQSTSELKLLLVEPAAAGGDDRSFANAVGDTRAASVALLVGPEGGWAAEERAALVDGGCTPVTLGGITLRADAVPIVAMALVRFALRDL